MAERAVEPMRRQKGFTLVELMISLALAALVSIILFTVYKGQERGSRAQTEIAQAQQTIRAAMDIIAGDLMNLGVDPTESGLYGIYRVNGDTGNVFNSATPNGSISAPAGTSGNEIELLVFSSDLDENGGVPTVASEVFVYKRIDCDAGIDWDNADGDNNHGTGNNDDTDCLRRQDGQAAIADNIEALEFNYLDSSEIYLDDGLDGAVPFITAANKDQIAFVEICMLVRTANPDADHVNNAVNSIYTCPSSGTVWGPFTADNYRRRFFSTRIRLRNNP